MRLQAILILCVLSAIVLAAPPSLAQSAEEEAPESPAQDEAAPVQEAESPEAPVPPEPWVDEPATAPTEEPTVDQPAEEPQMVEVEPAESSDEEQEPEAPTAPLVAPPHSFTGSGPAAPPLVARRRVPLGLSTRPWRIRLSAGFSQLIAQSPSLDPLQGDDAYALGGVNVEAELGLVGNTVPVILQVGYLNGQTRGELFDSFEAKSDLHGLAIGLMSGYRLWDAIFGYFRGGGTLSFTRARVDGSGDSPSALATTWARSLGFYPMGGVELTLPRRWMAQVLRHDLLTIGARVEGGYIWLGRFDLEGDEPSESLASHEIADLGTLELSGGAVRVEVLVSF